MAAKLLFRQKIGVRTLMLCICYTMPSRDLCKIHEGMFDKPEGVARGFITHSRVFLHRSLEGMV